MKKFLSLFLIFSLVTINCASLRTTGGKREKHGATLIITKKDGQQIEGELVNIKPNSLLLLNTKGKDESIDIADIRIIRIVKKSWDSIGMGMGIGGLIGAGIGALVGYAKGDDPLVGHRFGDVSAGTKALFYGFIFMDIGGLLGGIIGVIAGIDKKIHLEGMSDSEILETLDKLRKKARIRDYK